MRRRTVENRIAPIPELTSIRDMIDEVTSGRNGTSKKTFPINTFESKKELMDEKNISDCLQKHNYSEDAIADCVRWDPSGTLEQVYKVTKEGRLKIEERDGRSAWRALLKGLSEVGSEELMEGEKRFYDAIATERQRLHDRGMGGYLVLASTIMTLGQAGVPEHVGRWYDRRLYQRTAHKKLGNY